MSDDIVQARTDYRPVVVFADVDIERMWGWPKIGTAEWDWVYGINPEPPTPNRWRVKQRRVRDRRAISKPHA